MADRFYIKFQGAVYAEGPICFRDEFGNHASHEDTDDEILDALKHYLDLDEIPKGFEFWRTND